MEREMQIYMPTAEQMAERARLLGQMPWVAEGWTTPRYARPWPPS